ncbi:hypothetical protein NTGM5_500005 [Candidatus Nitrotoga sp. M5]|nr:hypothetical protein NTGM5_500005 [Candidatus Nitrotoga sp. M5]
MEDGEEVDGDEEELVGEPGLLLFAQPPNNIVAVTAPTKIICINFIYYS